MKFKDRRVAGADTPNALGAQNGGEEKLHDAAVGDANDFAAVRMQVKQLLDHGNPALFACNGCLRARYMMPIASLLKLPDPLGFVGADLIQRAA